MPSDVEIEALHRGYEHVNRREFDEAVAIYDDEIEWHDPPAMPGAGVHHGKDAVRASWESWGESWERWGLAPVETIANGEDVFVEVVITGRGRGSGLEVSLTYFQVWTYSDGLVIRQRSFADRGDALRAAGIEPGA